MAVREDTWLSAVFGYPVLAVEGEPEHISGRGPALCYAKVNVRDVERAARFGVRGFSVVDVNVTLTLDPAGARLSADSRAVVQARPEHHERLLEVAGSCFRFSRFHLDPAIPRELANRVKREWLRSYLEGRRGIELLAALEDGRPVGFLAALEAARARVIDLVGVAEHAQGSGIGASLVDAFIERHAPHCEELRVGTQIANVPSLRLYASRGFVIDSAAYVLHRHLAGS